jgi:proteasome lid subunit RPN8/RPN11
VRDIQLGSKRTPQLGPKPSDRVFRSDDAKFGLKIRGNEFGKILEYCRGAERLETGGILVGNYSEGRDVAFVSRVSKAPRDSKSGATWFYRGIQGLQAWLHSLWSSDHYYLGEWHFHPGGRPIPSDRDVLQIKEISESPKYCCPEPILLIIGGCPSGAWEVGAYVSPRKRSLVELRELEDARD